LDSFDKWDKKTVKKISNLFKVDPNLVYAAILTEQIR